MSYCYFSVNIIILGLIKTDPIKQIILYNISFIFKQNSNKTVPFFIECNFLHFCDVKLSTGFGDMTTTYSVKEDRLHLIKKFNISQEFILSFLNAFKKRSGLYHTNNILTKMTIFLKMQSLICIPLHLKK